jgi:hypothetical protein
VSNDANRYLCTSRGVQEEIPPFGQHRHTVRARSGHTKHTGSVYTSQLVTHNAHIFHEYWNDQPVIEKDAANGVDSHHVLTLVVSPFSGVEKLAHILTNFEVG